MDDYSVAPLTICMIDINDFIGSHLCEKLMHEMYHVVLAVDVSTRSSTSSIQRAAPHETFHRCSRRHEHNAAHAPHLPRPF
jgi:nucleoside-diphosphate-sugar epimerase